VRDGGTHTELARASTLKYLPVSMPPGCILPSQIAALSRRIHCRAVWHASPLPSTSMMTIITATALMADQGSV